MTTNRSSTTAASVPKPAEVAKTVIHYLEIVTADRDATSKLLSTLHGLTFTPDACAGLGNARIATRADGTLIGVRMPLHLHEKSVTRPHFLVPNLPGCGAE